MRFRMIADSDKGLAPMGPHLCIKGRVANELLGAIPRLDATVAAQDTVIAELKATIAEKDQRIAELEACVAKLKGRSGPQLAGVLHSPESNLAVVLAPAGRGQLAWSGRFPQLLAHLHHQDAPAGRNSPLTYERLNGRGKTRSPIRYWPEDASIYLRATYDMALHRLFIAAK